MADRQLTARIVARDEASPSIRQATESVERLDRTFTDISRDVQQAAKDFRAGKISLDDYTTAVRFAQREAQALQATGIKPVGQELRSLNAITKEAGSSAHGARDGMGSLRSAMGSLAFTTAGLPGRLGEVSSVISGFALGSLTSAGIFAGLAGIAAAWKAISREANEARDAQKEALEEARRLGTTRISELQGTLGALRGGLRGDESALADARTLQAQERQLRGVQETRFDVQVLELSTKVAEGKIAIANVERELERLRASQNRERDRKVGGVGGVGGAATEPESVADAIARLASGSPLMMDISRRQAAASRARATAAGQAINPGQAPEVRGTITMPEVSRLTEGGSLREVLDFIAADLAEAGKGIEVGSKQLVGALATAAHALAGMITGQSSVLGGLGGLTAGLSNIPALAGFANPLGFASIGFSFLDALTSSRARDSMSDAHLAALRAHDRERPPANIYVNIDPFDPTNRRHQRLIDEARREAQASGYNPRVNT